MAKNKASGCGLIAIIAGCLLLIGIVKVAYDAIEPYLSQIIGWGVVVGFSVLVIWIALKFRTKREPEVPDNGRLGEKSPRQSKRSGDWPADIGKKIIDTRGLEDRIRQDGTAQVFSAQLAGVHVAGRRRSAASASMGEELFAIREPENPADANAIAIYRYTGKQIGYIPAFVASDMAPRMDRGEVFRVRVKDIEVGDRGTEIWMLVEKV